MEGHTASGTRYRGQWNIRLNHIENNTLMQREIILPRTFLHIQHVGD